MKLILSIVFSLLTSITVIAQNEKKVFNTSFELENQIGNTITIEGEIVHVCPVDGKKMKLILNDTSVVSVLNANKSERFDPAQWNQTRVQITGVLACNRISAREIDSVYQQKELLCHVDNAPCLDKQWQENKWKNGTAQQSLDSKNQKLHEKMQQTGKNYIPVFSITTHNIEKIEE